MQLKRYLAVAAAILATALAAGWALRANPPAPSVAYTLLDGSPQRTEQLRGKVVLVNFWATSCAVCLKEMPALVAAHQKFQARGYETLAVAMHYDPPAAVVDYSTSRKLPFRVAIDHDGGIARSFGDVQLTPTSVVINRRGEIVKRYLGAPDFAALDALLERLLAES